MPVGNVIAVIIACVRASKKQERRFIPEIKEGQNQCFFGVLPMKRR
jgi:hypothetical protein